MLYKRNKGLLGQPRAIRLFQYIQKERQLKINYKEINRFNTNCMRHSFKLHIKIRGRILIINT